MESESDVHDGWLQNSSDCSLIIIDQCDFCMPGKSSDMLPDDNITVAW